MQYQFSKDFCSVIRLDDGVIVKFDDSDPNKAEFDEWALTNLPLQPDYSLEELQEANKGAPIIPVPRALQWYEDAFVDKPELIQGLWFRVMKTIDLREDPTKLEELRQRKLAELARIRFDHETQGMLFQGAFMKSDRETQATVGNAYTQAKNRPTFTVSWKAATGFVKLDAATIIQFGDALSDFVQWHFTKEEELNIALNAATTLEELLAVDIETGWEI